MPEPNTDCPTPQGVGVPSCCVDYFFQPFFMAAYALSLIVDLDFGREVPAALRLLIFPTNEFFMSSPIAFLRLCHVHLSTNHYAHKTICGAGCRCPWLEP